MILVATDIENGFVIHLVRRRENLPQHHEVGEVSLLDDSIPALERIGGVWMLRCEVVQAFTSYDVHGYD